MSLPPDMADTICKLLLATALGGVLGLERERKHRAAGLRTHIIVCLASTVAMIASNRLAEEWLAVPGTAMPLDRGRIVAGILQGIGFIGAGAIINVGSIHRGLTTAAMIWFVSVLGVAIGLGYYAIAVVSTAFALAAVLLLEPLGDWLSGSIEFSLRVRVPGGPQRVQEIERFIVKQGYRVNATRLTIGEKEEMVKMQFVIGAPRKSAVEDLVQQLNSAYADIEQITVER